MKSRITIVEQIAYQSDDFGPVSLETQPYSYIIESDEQPYRRVIAVGEDWQRLDTGWVLQPSLLVVENIRQARNTYPTTVESESAENAVVEIAVGEVPIIEILPGERTRFRPVTTLTIRCRKGKARAAVTAVPR